MKKIVLAAIAISICIFSCSKENDQLQKSQPDISGNYIWNCHGPAKKETRPIVILKPVRPNGVSLPSGITLTNDTDILAGQTSNEVSERQFELPRTGEWLVTITSPGYQTINKTVNYQDSFVYQVDTLQPVN